MEWLATGSERTRGREGLSGRFPLSVSDSDGTSIKGADKLFEAYQMRLSRVVCDWEAKVESVLSKAKLHSSSPTLPNQQHQHYALS
jgi:hypothetical protein